MIFVGVTIVVGVLILAGTCAHFVQRRSALAAETRRKTKQRHQSLAIQDELVIESLIDSVMNGQPLAEGLPEFMKARAALLPEGSNGGNWTNEDVGSVLSRQLRENIESINRRLFLPMFLAALLIVALTVIAASTLYTFFESSTPSRSPVPASNGAPYDPFAVDPFAKKGDL